MTRVYGLVLAGGRSVRMGRDKAAIDYHGLPHVEWAHAMLARVCDDAFVSRAFGASDERAYVLSDPEPDLGPVGGVLAAHARDPRAAWLVVACDMPGFDEASARRLLALRGSDFDAVCFCDDVGRVEPLAAIYEPAALCALACEAAEGERSLSRFLSRLGPRLGAVRPARAGETDSVNTPDELTDFLRRREPLP